MTLSPPKLRSDNGSKKSRPSLASNFMPFGFGVLELVIVMAILIGLGVTVFPKAQVFWAQAHQNEAKQILSQAHSLEIIYHQFHGRYINDFNAIGYQQNGANVTPTFVAAPRGKRYSLSFQGTADDKSFTILATALPNALAPCQKTPDVWGIDADKTLTNKNGGGVDGVKDGLKGCH